jgi:hypothetical protein
VAVEEVASYPALQAATLWQVAGVEGGGGGLWGVVVLPLLLAALWSCSLA